MTPALSKIIDATGAKKNGVGYKGHCLAHDDSNPSLSISEGDDGRVLLKCHAGCTTDAVVRSMGMTMAELMPDKVPQKSAEASPRIVATYDYTDESGKPLFRVARRSDKQFPQFHPDGRGGWVKGLGGVTRVLYALPRLAEATADSFVFFPEGEKDADRINGLGGIATTTSGGAGNSRHTDLSRLHGLNVVLLADNDRPGIERCNADAERLHGKAASVRVITFPDLPEGGDVSDWFDAGHDLEELVTLAEQTPEWEPGSRNDIVELIPQSEQAPRPVPVTFGELAKAHPHLPEVVVDGVVRRGETCNVIGSTKSCKTWLVHMLGLSVASGGRWLDTFLCTPGRVLIVDNELHPSTLAKRIPDIADELGIAYADYADKIDVLSLRGQGVSIDDLQHYIDDIEAGEYALIILDAWYRFIPKGVSENSNADVMAMYNRLDHYAAKTQAAWVVVHHTSKGNQSEKSVTDTGAGAGSQSRAADTHLVLRPHEEDGCVVMDAAVRSFPPFDPIALRWTYPTWTRAYSLDVKALKGKKSAQEERQEERDAEGLHAIRDALAGGPLTTRQIRNATGFGRDRVDRLLSVLIQGREVDRQEVTGQGGKQTLYSLRTGTGTGTDHRTSSG